MGHLNRVLGHIRRLLRPTASGAATDCQLLERFAANRDEAAFTALVERHGALVRGVCRRLLSDDNDVDDAFQATFLVLARKAGALSRPGSLTGWLHGVAHRVALNLRKSAARRGQHERGAAAVAQTSVQDDGPEPDLRPLLDEELRALDDKYRVPLLLCYLEGKTNEEAARELGWPAGTVAGRLARARELLRVRLTRRGLTLSAAALAARLTEQSASAAVSGALIQNTVQSALRFTAKAAVQTATTPAVTLAEGVLRAMSLTKVKLIAAISLALVVALGAAGFVAHRLLGDNAARASALVPAERNEDNAAADEAVRLFSVYMDDLFAGAHFVSLVGKLGENATLTLDPNGCGLDNYGNRAACLEGKPRSVAVKIRLLPDVGKGDPLGRRVYDLVGAPEPIHLVVPGKEGSVFRLLHLDNDGKVTRAITLERPGPKVAIPKEVKLATAYLNSTIVGRVQRVTLTGKLGGAAELYFDPNACELTALGDPGKCTQVKGSTYKVKLREVAMAKAPAGVSLYDIEGARPPLRLMLSTAGACRLLVLSEPVPGNAEAEQPVSRVIPLETIR
jgi:RNA polymerase sigma factor (sigma-70 family)